MVERGDQVRRDVGVGARAAHGLAVQRDHAAGTGLPSASP
jgi:hypothetical protein